MQPVKLVVPALALFLTGFAAVAPDSAPQPAAFDRVTFNATQRDVPLVLSPQASALLSRFVAR
jgi:hypothetical protein